MKTCTKCGAVNKDDNNFCNSCGCPTFSTENTASAHAAGAPATPPPMATNTAPSPAAPMPPLNMYKKPEFTMYDLFTIFGFVAAIIGNFVIGLILEPLALAASIAGFARGKRYRGLAIAAIVIAAIALLIRFFITLHENGLIPEWLITGTFD